MNVYVAIVVRQYAEGRICISTDRVGHYLSGKGGSRELWRKMFEWVGQKHKFETIRVAVINPKSIPYRNRIADINPISFQDISVSDMSYKSLEQYDAIYLIGLPSEISEDLKNIIEKYVKNGGGILIEAPDIEGEIEILSGIDSVICSSVNRPNVDKAYWTVDGQSHYMYSDPVIFGFLNTMLLSDFSSDWLVLMSSVYSGGSSTPIIIPLTPYDIGSSFGIGYTIAMQKGIIEMEIDLSTSSSSSLDSSSSSSSSSLFDDKYWNFCDNIVAYWKMDENYNSSVVWDQSGNFKHMGMLKSNSSSIYTSSRHVSGIVNGALSFDGYSHSIKTYDNQTLNFADVASDLPFSISFWIYPKNSSGYVLNKDDVWEVRIYNQIINVMLKSETVGYFRVYSAPLLTIPLDRWSNISLSYDGTLSGMSIYYNGASQFVGGGEIPYPETYVKMSNVNSSLYFANDGNANFFNGYIDNVIIIRKVISEIEAEALWNIGRGNEECEGVYKYTSSSSSSSSTSSSSDTSNSSTSSSSSIDSSSSSSSSSSEEYSSSSSSSYFDCLDTWVPKDDFREWVDVAMSNDGTIQTAVVYNGFIYVSTDSGNTWIPKKNDMIRKWEGVAMSSDGTIQTATESNGGFIYVSTDSGNTWTSNFSSSYLVGVAMSSNGTIQTAVVNGGYIYVSTNSGNNWNVKGSPGSWYGVAMSSDGTIQTATDSNNGQIYVSTDSGNNWTAKDSNRYWANVAMSSDGTIQTATVWPGQIYVSTDSGNNWTAKDSVRDWVGVAMSSDGTIQTATTNPGYIYVSTDSGNNWTAKDNIRDWQGVAMSGEGLIQTAVVSGGQIYVSTCPDYFSSSSSESIGNTSSSSSSESSESVGNNSSSSDSSNSSSSDSSNSSSSSSSDSSSSSSSINDLCGTNFTCIHNDVLGSHTDFCSLITNVTLFNVTRQYSGICKVYGNIYVSTSLPNSFVIALFDKDPVLYLDETLVASGIGDATIGSQTINIIPQNGSGINGTITINGPIPVENIVPGTIYLCSFILDTSP